MGKIASWFIRLVCVRWIPARAVYDIEGVEVSRVWINNLKNAPKPTKWFRILDYQGGKLLIETADEFLTHKTERIKDDER